MFFIQNNIAPAPYVVIRDFFVMKQSELAEIVSEIQAAIAACNPTVTQVSAGLTQQKHSEILVEFHNHYGESCKEGKKRLSDRADGVKLVSVTLQAGKRIVQLYVNDDWIYSESSFGFYVGYDPE